MAPMGNPPTIPRSIADAAVRGMPNIIPIGLPMIRAALSERPELFIIETAAVNGNSEGIMPCAHISRAFFTDCEAKAGRVMQYAVKKSASAHSIASENG